MPLSTDVSHIEGLIPKEFGHDAVEVPGARALLDQLEAVHAPWIIVTSGTRALVTGWLDVLKMPWPETMVVSEDVSEGKPNPQCYLLGQQRLGLPKEAEMIVFEDAPAGVRAGKAAGFKVLGLATTHSIEQIRDAGADWIVEDMRSVTMEGYDKSSGKLRLRIVNALI